MRIEEYAQALKLLASRKELFRDTCFCGTQINIDALIQHHDHSDGLMVEGFSKRQWLWIECEVCNHQWDLKKLLPKEWRELAAE